jgi:7-cyano-7-deazaguanine synthase
MNKVLVLASGGLDSTCLLHKAVKEYGAENVYALNMYYGQKHHKEMECFQWQLERLGIKNYRILDLSSIFAGYKGCTLLEGGGDIPHESYAEQLAKKPGVVSTYVPFRNGLFLSVAASVALQEQCNIIWYGAHADDAAGNAYPDCTEEFINNMSDAIWEGSGGMITMNGPWKRLNKAGVVAEGIKAGMTQEDFEHTWSCYEGGDEPCGKCGTCIDRKAALEANGLKNC